MKNRQFEKIDPGREGFPALPPDSKPSRARRDGRDLLPKTVLNADPEAHVHTESDVTDLGSYSPIGHSHVEANISDLGAYLEDITAESIGDLSDVDTTTAAPTDGQALIWDSVGSEWVPGDVAASGGGGSSLGGIALGEPTEVTSNTAESGASSSGNYSTQTAALTNLLSDEIIVIKSISFYAKLTATWTLAVDGTDVGTDTADGSSPDTLVFSGLDVILWPGSSADFEFSQPTSTQVWFYSGAGEEILDDINVGAWQETSFPTHGVPIAQIVYDKYPITSVSPGNGPVLIEEVTTASSQSSVTFSSIPTTYDSLMIVGSIRSTRTGSEQDEIKVTVGNGTVDTGTNYAVWASDADQATSFNANDSIDSNDHWIPFRFVPPTADAPTSIEGRVEMRFFDVQSAAYKSMRGEAGVGHAAGGWGIGYGVWKSTSTIDIITISWTNGNFVDGSTLRLYGFHNKDCM